MKITIKEFDHLQQFPKIVTAERPIPVELWPDLKGVRDAKVITWKPTQKNWDKFWKMAVRFPIVSVDYETGDTLLNPGVGGLKPFHGSRPCGVAACFFDGKEIQGGYWNFRHRGHEPHMYCVKHQDELKAIDKSEAVQATLDMGKILKRMEKCETCKKGECPGYVEEYPELLVEELKKMIPVFSDKIVAGQNFKFDSKHGYAEGLPIPERVIDTMLVAHLFNENQRGYNLDGLGKEIGETKKGDSVKDYMNEHDLDIAKTGHAQVPCEVEAPYAVMDTVIVLKRLQFERERWQALDDPKMMEVFQIEMAQTPVFARMEANGMKMDREYIRRGIEVFEREMKEIEDAIHKEAGAKFNVLSTDELWVVLEKRGLKPISLTAKGHKPSLTDQDLGQYKDAVCNLVKAYRSRNKMWGTYFKPFLDTHMDANDVLHSDFFIHGTVSGRISCREPNLTNMTRFERFGTRGRTGSVAQAIREGVGLKEELEFPNLEVRRCFIPRDENYSLFYFDYGQAEMRVFAEYSNEQFLIKALTEGLDIHAATASKVFPNFPKKEDDKKLYEYFRQLAKQISFGLLYGMGVNKLSVQMDVPVDETVRLVLIAKAWVAEGKSLKAVSAYTLQDLDKVLEDHRVMTTTRQWAGLGALGKDVSRKINPEPIEAFLFRGDPEMKKKYLRIETSAKTFMNNYHKQFPNIKPFIKGIERALGTRGYIFNKYGRRYHLTTDESYIGINRLVQGSTGDMVKLAQWRIDNLLKGKKSMLLNQVHDELQFDMHHSELWLVPKIHEAMGHFPNLGVKMTVDVDYSHESWASKHKWKGDEEFLASLKDYRKMRMDQSRGLITYDDKTRESAPVEPTDEGKRDVRQKSVARSSGARKARRATSKV